MRYSDFDVMELDEGTLQELKGLLTARGYEILELLRSQEDGGYSLIDIGERFGIPWREMVQLVKEIKRVTARTFYHHQLTQEQELIVQAGVAPEVVRSLRRIAKKHTLAVFRWVEECRRRLAERFPGADPKVIDGLL